MLYLIRKEDQEIIINGNIIIKVVEVNRKNVKLGFDFPDSASVIRKELIDKARANGTEEELFRK